MNRANKQGTLAFVRRTLAWYRRFEETGTSCFSEPVFQDMFFSVSSQKDVSASVKDQFTSGRQSGISLAGNQPYAVVIINHIHPPPMHVPVGEKCRASLEHDEF